MTPYKRGDVVLVAFPFTDLSTTKMRPSLVISSDEFNKRYADIILIAITSQIPEQLSAEDFSIPFNTQKEAGLPKPSIIRLGKIVTLDQRLVRKKLGKLSNALISSITIKLHKILS